MKKKLVKIGSSQGLIIDKAILSLLGIEKYLELKVDGNKLIITASQEKDQ